MNIIEALNNPLTKCLIEEIEDLESSLQSYPNGEPRLKKLLANRIIELSNQGYNWGE